MYPWELTLLLFFPCHLLAEFIIAYGPVTATYAADATNKNSASIDVAGCRWT